MKYLVTGTTPTADNAYFWALRGYTSGGAGADNSGSAQGLSYVGWSVSAAGGSGGFSLDIYNPFLSTKTLSTSMASSFEANYVGREGMLGYGTVASLTGIQFLTNAAPTFSSGQVQIYGYRKA